MGSKTTKYGLSQYDGADIPKYRGAGGTFEDYTYNGDMAKIERGMNDISGTVSINYTRLSDVSGAADTKFSTKVQLTDTSGYLNTRITDVSGAATSKFTQVLDSTGYLNNRITDVSGAATTKFNTHTHDASALTRNGWTNFIMMNTEQQTIPDKYANIDIKFTSNSTGVIGGTWDGSGFRPDASGFYLLKCCLLIDPSANLDEPVTGSIKITSSGTGFLPRNEGSPTIAHSVLTSSNPYSTGYVLLNICTPLYLTPAERVSIRTTCDVSIAVGANQAADTYLSIVRLV